VSPPVPSGTTDSGVNGPGVEGNKVVQTLDFLDSQSVAQCDKVDHPPDVQDEIRDEHFEKKAAEVAANLPDNSGTTTTYPFSNASGAALQNGEPVADIPRPKLKPGAPGLAQFKERIGRRKCILCGRSFPYDLTRYDVGDKHGYVCTTCLMGGAPPAPEATRQDKLPGGAAA